MPNRTWHQMQMMDKLLDQGHQIAVVRAGVTTIYARDPLTQFTSITPCPPRPVEPTMCWVDECPEWLDESTEITKEQWDFVLNKVRRNG